MNLTEAIDYLMSDAIGELDRECAVRAARTLDHDALIDAAAGHIYSVVQDRQRYATLRVERAAARRRRHPKWCDCDSCERISNAAGDALGRSLATLGEVLDKFKEDLRVEWTAELLAETFRLGDGTVATWGEATIEQHQQRIAMLSANALANLEAATRHELAIEDIRAAGVPCLGALVVAA